MDPSCTDTSTKFSLSGARLAVTVSGILWLVVVVTSDNVVRPDIYISPLFGDNNVTFSREGAT